MWGDVGIKLGCYRFGISSAPGVLYLQVETCCICRVDKGQWRSIAGACQSCCHIRNADDGTVGVKQDQYRGESRLFVLMAKLLKKWTGRGLSGLPAI